MRDLPAQGIAQQTSSPDEEGTLCWRSNFKDVLREPSTNHLSSEWTAVREQTNSENMAGEFNLEGAWCWRSNSKDALRGPGTNYLSSEWTAIREQTKSENMAGEFNLEAAGVPHQPDTPNLSTALLHPAVGKPCGLCRERFAPVELL